MYAVSLRGPAAVNGKQGSCQRGRFLGCQERAQSGNFVCIDKAFCRLRGELQRLDASPIVLNTRLREAVLRRAASDA